MMASSQGFAEAHDLQGGPSDVEALANLPPGLHQNTIILRSPSPKKALVYLLGTAHVSQVSLEASRTHLSRC